MRTEPEGSTAADAAGDEAIRWLEVADGVPEGWSDVAPSEAAVIRFHDPGADLASRAAKWGHRLPDHEIGSLALFAAGLARAEADAWTQDEPHIATSAYEARRFLLGDRILHWAVPWFDIAGRCYPEHRAGTHHARDMLLAIGDRLRPAPDLGVDTGPGAFGEDAYGPIRASIVDGAHLRSLWSGTLLLDTTVRSMAGVGAGIDDVLSNPVTREELGILFTIAVARWHGFAMGHPGSAALWVALGDRARRTARALVAA